MEDTALDILVHDGQAFYDLMYTLLHVLADVNQKSRMDFGEYIQNEKLQAFARTIEQDFDEWDREWLPDERQDLLSIVLEELAIKTRDELLKLVEKTWTHGSPYRELVADAVDAMLELKGWPALNSETDAWAFGNQEMEDDEETDDDDQEELVYHDQLCLWGRFIVTCQEVEVVPCEEGDA